MAREQMEGEQRLRTILYLAVGSRVLVASLFILWRSLANSYDTSAELNHPCISSGIHSPSAPKIEGGDWGQRLGQALERTVVWDGVYYVRIAECGYEYEQTYAFLPIFPMLLSLLTHSLLHNFIPILGLRATLALSGYIISNTSFVLAAYFLYRLTDYLLKDKRLTTTAVALFCLNPASTFYSAIYSESVFSLFSFAGLWYFVKEAKWTAVVFFGLSSGVRSNGLLHAGFFLFQAMHRAYTLAFYQRRLLAVAPIVLGALLQTCAVAAPFVAFQGYGFYQLCLQHDAEKMHTVRPWCESSLPYLYGFVQSHYWNVGFLRYFQLKQFPNFLLASPMLSLAICAIVKYAMHQPKIFFLLGLATPSSIQSKVAFMDLVDTKTAMTLPEQGLKEEWNETLSSHSQHDKEILTRRRKRGRRQSIETTDIEREASAEEGFHSPAVLCFLIQLCFMTSVAMFIMHVQVATRFLSVSPPIYWYGAHVLNSGTKNTGKLLWSVFLCYNELNQVLSGFGGHPPSDESQLMMKKSKAGADCTPPLKQIIITYILPGLGVGLLFYLVPAAAFLYYEQTKPMGELSQVSRFFSIRFWYVEML